MEDLMRRLTVRSQEICAYEKCSTQANHASSSVSLKACAACGIVSYCSKGCQRLDWSRHKPLCIDCRPFKDYSEHMVPMQKNMLNVYSMLELPPIDDEYHRKYPGEIIQNLMVKGGLTAAKNMISTNLHETSGHETSDQDTLKRWQEISQNLFDFLLTASPGDVFLKKEYNVYDPGAPQQFRNTPMSEPTRLENGKDIVDIGFVDFGIAFDSIDTLSLDGDPLNVIGFEAEAQCVAKALVMIEMMKDIEVNARSIAEVWLSSLWSKKTLKAFKKALRRLLESVIEVEPKVKAIIKFWKDTPKISRKSALDFQFKAVWANAETKFAQECCSLELEADRVGFLRYYFTKAWYEDGATTVGSIVMCKNNETLGVKQLFGSCFEAAPWHIHNPDDPNYRHGHSFIGRTKLYFEDKLETYMHHIRKGSLIFTPKFGIVSIQHEQVIHEIKMVNPYIISWSNVVDYINPKEFHAIAKKISGPDTVHSLHSCNWTSRVHGTDVYDINRITRLHFYSGGLQLMECGHGMIEGIKLHAPYHFRDICTAILGRKYVNKFFQYFFKNESVNCACSNGNTPLKVMSPFARCVSTAHIAFTYKETGISFGLDSYDFLNDDN